jgi:hypothetical protein
MLTRRREFCEPEEYPARQFISLGHPKNLRDSSDITLHERTRFMMLKKNSRPVLRMTFRYGPPHGRFSERLSPGCFDVTSASLSIFTNGTTWCASRLILLLLYSGCGSCATGSSMFMTKLDGILATTTNLRFSMGA